MRPLGLVALVALISAGAAAGQPDSLHPLAPNWRRRNGDRITFRLLPATGAGVGTQANDICSWMSSQGLLQGGYFCVDGTGSTTTAVGYALTATNVTTVSRRACPNGTDCTAVSAQSYNGSTSYLTTPTEGPYTGDYSCWALFRTPTAVAMPLINQRNGTNAQSMFIMDESTAGNTVTWRVWDATGAFTSIGTVSAGGAATPTGWGLQIGTYRRAGAGTSTLFNCIDTVTCQTSTTGVLSNQTVSLPFRIGSRSDLTGSFRGEIRSAGCTEHELSSSERAAMLARVQVALADTKGGAVTNARTNARSCVTSDGVYTTSSLGQPCITGGALHVGPAVTNPVRWSEKFDDASWTKTNVTVTADQENSPEVLANVDQLVSTVNGGLAQSTAFAIASTSAVASVWARVTAGSGGTLELYDTTASASRCTASITGSTLARFQCSSSSLTSGNNHVLRVYPGGTGSTGTVMAWGAQTEAGATVAGRYVVTMGATLTSNADSITATAPSAGWPTTTGCVALDYTPDFSSTFPSDLHLFSTQNGTNGIGLKIVSTGEIRLEGTVSTVAKNHGTSAAQSWTAGQTYRIRVDFEPGNTSMWRDGVSLGAITQTDSTSGQVTAGSMYLGSNYTGTTQARGTIKNMVASRSVRACN
jgi:hypothetical protein